MENAVVVQYSGKGFSPNKGSARSLLRPGGRPRVANRSIPRSRPKAMWRAYDFGLIHAQGSPQGGVCEDSVRRWGPQGPKAYRSCEHLEEIRGVGYSNGLGGRVCSSSEHGLGGVIHQGLNTE